MKNSINFNTYIAKVTGEDLTQNQITQIHYDPAVANPAVSYGWNIVSIMMIVAAYGFMLAILIGGIQYLFSMGGEESIAKSKKTFLNSVMGLVIVFFSYGILSFIIDQFGPTFQSGSFSLAGLLGQVFGLLIPLSGAGFLLILLFGGFTYLTAAGNDEQVGKAKKMMTAGVIGIALVAFSFGIGSAVLTTLGIK